MLEDSVWPSLLWMLLCIALITGAAYWVTRYMAGKGALAVFGGGAGHEMELLDQLALGREQRLMLARVGERFFLLGVTAGEISALAEFTAEEAALWKREQGETSQSPSFREALRLTLKNRGRR